MAKKRKDSSAAFTILVGAIAAIIFAFVIVSAPRASNPKPSPTMVAFQDVQAAGSIYNFDLQAIELGNIALHNSGNPTLNKLGTTWLEHFKADKTEIARWLKKQNQSVNADGRGMPHNFSLDPQILKQLTGAPDSRIAQTMLGLTSALLSSNANSQVKDPTVAASIEAAKSLLESSKQELSSVR
jgi:hypothetical protein